MTAYKRTFTVPVPPERAWEAFTDPAQLRVWHGTADVFEATPGGRVRFSDPGYEPVEGSVDLADPPRRLRWSLIGDGSTITETLEPIQDGTRITVEHDTEGVALAEHELEGLRLGWDESISDLILYLEHGVAFTRHMAFRSLIGVSVRTTPGGIEVVSVRPGTFGEAVGLEPGDLLVQIGTAPILHRSDLGLIMREHDPGEEIDAVFVRSGSLRRARAHLSVRRSSQSEREEQAT